MNLFDKNNIPVEIGDAILYAVSSRLHTGILLGVTNRYLKISCNKTEYKNTWSTRSTYFINRNMPMEKHDNYFYKWYDSKATNCEDILLLKTDKLNISENLIKFITQQ